MRKAAPSSTRNFRNDAPRRLSRYLVTQFGIAPARLSAKGYGKSQLLDPANPEDGVNRRVQVINVTASAPRN